MNKTKRREIASPVTTTNVEDTILQAIADGVTELVVNETAFKTIIKWGIQTDVHDFNYGQTLIDGQIIAKRFDRVCGIEITIKK